MRVVCKDCEYIHNTNHREEDGIKTTCPECGSTKFKSNKSELFQEALDE